MKKAKAWKLAKLVARTLFTNGSGERAARLVLELSDGRDGGGWNERAVRLRIYEKLKCGHCLLAAEIQKTKKRGVCDE